MTKHAEQETYTVRQAAARLFGDESSAAIRQVQRLIERGELSAQKLPGQTGPYLIPLAAILAFEEKRRQSKTG